MILAARARLLSCRTTRKTLAPRNPQDAGARAPRKLSTSYRPDPQDVGSGVAVCGGNTCRAGVEGLCTKHTSTDTNSPGGAARRCPPQRPVRAGTPQAFRLATLAR